MCNYTFSLDDRLVDRISPRFSSDESLRQWMQRQLELIIIRYVDDTAMSSPSKEDAIQRLNDLTSGKSKGGLKDLKGIMASSSKTAEQLKEAYISEKYDV